MSSSPTDVLVDVTMPQMGVSVAEGTVVAWRVEVGDPIEADATIAEISTDKIDTEVPAPASGVVTEILVPVESTVSVGTVLARIATGASQPQSLDGESAGPARTETPSPSPSVPAACRQRASATPLLTGRPTDRRGARDRPGSGFGDRPRRARAQAGRARARGVRAGRGAAAAHREPLPTGPGGAGRFGRSVPDAPADRPAHEALARDDGDVHDVDRGRHEPRGGCAGGPWGHRARVRRTGVRSTRCASTRR